MFPKGVTMVGPAYTGADSPDSLFDDRANADDGGDCEYCSSGTAVLDFSDE
jgi:hypothetical protein